MLRHTTKLHIAVDRVFTRGPSQMKDSVRVCLRRFAYASAPSPSEARLLQRVCVAPAGTRGCDFRQ